MTNTIVFVNYTQPDNTAVSGYAISVMYVGMSLGAVILGPLADRFEPKHVLTGSLILTGIGCGILFLFSEATSVLLLMASLGILGFGPVKASTHPFSITLFIFCRTSVAVATMASSLENPHCSSNAYPQSSTATT